jgi:hypothetical protein
MMPTDTKIAEVARDADARLRRALTSLEQLPAGA